MYLLTFSFLLLVKKDYLGLQGGRKRKANHVTAESQAEFLEPITDTSQASDQWGGYTIQFCPDFTAKCITEQPQPPSGMTTLSVNTAVELVVYDMMIIA